MANYFEKVKNTLVINTFIKGKNKNTSYTFLGWDGDKLVYQINNSKALQRKKIHKDVIAAAKEYWEANERSEMSQTEWNIWLKDNFKILDWCHPSIIKHILTSIN